MSFVEAMKKAGFKPEKSSEGEFQPLEGIYKVQFVKAEQVTSTKDNSKQLRAEFKVSETLSGKDSNSKFNEFKKYLALEGDESVDKKKGVAWLVNALFTSGFEVTGATDEEQIASIQSALGTDLYFKAWGWRPEDGDKAFQQFSVLKEAIATKQAEAARKKSGVGF